MRKHIAAIGIGVALAALPALGNAAPLLPSLDQPRPLAVTPVMGGCGPGAAPSTWYDAYGRPRTSCVAIAPMAPPPPACGWGRHWATWQDVYGRVHSRCVRN